MGKSIKVAKALLGEMTSNNYHCSNERPNLENSNDKYDVDAVSFLASKVDTITK